MNQKNLRRSGQALLMVTVSLFFIFGLMGLAVDLGWAYFRREASQTAADAAAAAVIRAALSNSPGSQTCGANKVWCGTTAGTETACPATAPTTPSTSFDNGCMLAAANGFTTTASRRVTIQANTTSSAPTVPGTAVTYWATVRISETSTAFFGLVGAHSSFTAGARATSAITSSTVANTNPCMYVLSSHATNALSVGNGAHLTTSSCGIYVNSDASPALLVNGGATITSGSVKVTGTASISNGASVSSSPSTGVAAVADPFASLPSPTPSGTCTSGNFSSWQATAYTPSPGTYCSGFSLANGMAAVMSPGIYIISGGTFSIQGGSNLTASGGVMIYLTNGATLNIANGAGVTLSAQTSGVYQGVLFYQDRAVTSPGASNFSGGASMHMSGSLYFPKAQLNFDNGSSTSSVMAIIANTLSFQGGASALQQSTSPEQTGLAPNGLLVSFIE